MGRNALQPLVAGLKDPADGPMRSLAIKISERDYSRLRMQAESLRCYPSTLARGLVRCGLDQLNEGVG